MSDSSNKSAKPVDTTAGASAPSAAAETVKLDAVALRKLVVSTVLQVEDDGDGDAPDDGADDESDGDGVAVAGAARRRV